MEKEEPAFYIYIQRLPLLEEKTMENGEGRKTNREANKQILHDICCIFAFLTFGCWALIKFPSVVTVAFLF